MSKPKIAVFDFAGCEGDELQIVNLEEILLDVLGHVDVVNFREAMTEQSDDYDIAFIEGSCTRPSDEERLKEIRKNAKLVVAIGACATIGGINALKNHKPQEEVRRTVYGDQWELFDTYAARPIDAVIQVDAKVHGCPIDRTEFAHRWTPRSTAAPSTGPSSPTWSSRSFWARPPTYPTTRCAWSARRTRTSAPSSGEPSAWDP